MKKILFRILKTSQMDDFVPGIGNYRAQVKLTLGLIL